MNIELEILLTLVARGEMSGSQLINELNKRLGKNWLGLNKVNVSNLYPALYRLEVAGDITSRFIEEDVNKNGNRKKVFKITHKGGLHINSFTSNLDNLCLA